MYLIIPSEIAVWTEPAVAVTGTVVAWESRIMTLVSEQFVSVFFNVIDVRCHRVDRQDDDNQQTEKDLKRREIRSFQDNRENVTFNVTSRVRDIMMSRCNRRNSTVQMD